MIRTELKLAAISCKFQQAYCHVLFYMLSIHPGNNCIRSAFQYDCSPDKKFALGKPRRPNFVEARVRACMHVCVCVCSCACLSERLHEEQRG